MNVLAHTPLTTTVRLNRPAFAATAHCLTGCAIGEILGLVIGTAAGLGTWPTIVLAVVAMTLKPFA